MAKGNYPPRKKPNPALQNALLEKRIQERVNAAHQHGIDYGVLGTKIFMLMVLHDKHGITDKEELTKINKEIVNLADSLTKGYLSITDMLNAIREESGFTLSNDDLVKIDPTLGAFM